MFRFISEWFEDHAVWTLEEEWFHVDEFVGHEIEWEKPYGKKVSYYNGSKYRHAESGEERYLFKGPFNSVVIPTAKQPRGHPIDVFEEYEVR